MTAIVTKVLMLVATVVLVGWDIYVTVNAIRGDTISEIIARLGRNYAVLPFLWGVVVGHLFWSVRHIGHKKSKLAVLWCWVLMLLALDLVDVYDIAPIIPLFVGIVAGSALWPTQRDSVNLGNWKQGCL